MGGSLGVVSSLISSKQRCVVFFFVRAFFNTLSSFSADEKSELVLFLPLFEFGVTSLLLLPLPSSLSYESMYGVRPLKFSKWCLFPYFKIIKSRLLLIT